MVLTRSQSGSTVRSHSWSARSSARSRSTDRRQSHSCSPAHSRRCPSQRWRGCLSRSRASTSDSLVLRHIPAVPHTAPRSALDSNELRCADSVCVYSDGHERHVRRRPQLQRLEFGREDSAHSEGAGVVYAPPCHPESVLVDSYGNVVRPGAHHEVVEPAEPRESERQSSGPPPRRVERGECALGEVADQQ